MRKFTVTHEIDCTPEAFWKVFLDPDFNKALFLKGLEFPGYEMLDLQESEGEVLRKVRIQPNVNAPGPVKKLLGDRFEYVEDGRLDRKSQKWTWTTTPSAAKGKLRSEGTLTLEAIGEDRCRRMAEIMVEAKVFGIGSLIEGNFEKELKNGWEKSAAFMNRWLADHPPE